MYWNNDDDWHERWRQGQRTASRPMQLTFHPLAWMKLVAGLHHKSTEIAGFGITMESNPFYVDDFVTLPQEATAASFEFDNGAQSDFMMTMFERGIQPVNCTRIWIHTHPGDSATPSGTDESTLDKDFADQDWVVMFIVARGGQTSARLRMNKPFRADISLPVYVDWKLWPSVLQTEDMTALGHRWLAEFDKNVQQRVYVQPSNTYTRGSVWDATTRTWVPAGDRAATQGTHNGVRREVHITTERAPANDAVAPGLRVPDALFRDVKESEAAAATGKADVPAVVGHLPPAALDSGHPTTKPQRRKNDIPSRVQRLEDLFEAQQEQMEEVLEYVPMLEYLNENYPDFDGTRAREDEEITEIGDDIPDDDDEDSLARLAIAMQRAEDDENEHLTLD